jgi:DNA repair protein RadC
MCGPESAAEGIKKVFENMDREAFAVIALNTRNSMIAYNIVSIGSLSASIVHPREVFKFAILANASSILLAHNHPSGDPSPSRDDIELTSRFVKAGKMMGIEVLDHLIIGEETLSLKERGLM